MKYFNFKYDPATNTYIDSKAASLFIRKVFGWMVLGLAVTAFTFMAIVTNISTLGYVLNNYIFIAALLGMLFISSTLSFFETSLETTRILFLIYSLLTGITLTPLGMYEPQILTFTLLATIAIFGSMAAYGYLTEQDFSNVGPFFATGLILLIAMNLINFFIKVDTFSVAIAYFGSLLFMGLVAYKVNTLKQLAALLNYEDNADRYAVLGAFNLYLSFINLFLYLLRVLTVGRKRK